MNLIKTSPFYDSIIKGMALQGFRVFILASDGSENVIAGGTIGNMEAKNIVETIEETYLLFNKDNVVPIPLPKISKHYREMHKNPKELKKYGRQVVSTFRPNRANLGKGNFPTWMTTFPVSAIFKEVQNIP